VGEALEVYREAFRRFESSLTQDAVKRKFRVDGRLVVGLGEPTPLEVGLRLHWTYGVPFIPGSSLKGLAASYCHCVWGAKDGAFSQETVGDGRQPAAAPKDPTDDGEPTPYQIIFGSTEDAGHIHFYDAWLVPESLGARRDAGDGCIHLDVVTVHHRDYYISKSSERGPSGAGLVPPSDEDEPVPVQFLSVTGTFLVAVKADVPGPEGRAWAELAMQLLTEALRYWGAGGKTSSGYGRMSVVPS
jgi:CRISPR-associated protein Cmr6